MNNKNLFCDFCPCVWCDKNEENNEKITGYSFIPDPDHCKEMFKQEKELDYDTFLKAIFEIYGSTVNTDWHRYFENKHNENLSNDDKQKVIFDIIEKLKKTT